MTEEATVSTRDGTRRSQARSELIGGLAAVLFLLLGGWMILRGGAGEAAAAVVLWTAALALAGLGLGRPVTRPSAGDRRETGDGGVEPGSAAADAVASARRRLELAERLAVGPLGGFLGGAVVAFAVWATGAVGLADLLGVDLGAAAGMDELGRRLWTGAVWGVVLGVFYPRMPGGSAVGRGVMFSLIPATWALLVEYPFLRGQGWAGLGLGELTFALVILFHLVWGAVAGSLFQWAELTSEGRLDRPLGGGT